MILEQIYHGGGSESTQHYILEIAAILLVSFILGYLLRLLLNGNTKQRIKDLEDELALQNARTAPAELDNSQFELTIKKQKDEITALNTKLSDCYMAKIKAENDLRAASTKATSLKAAAPAPKPVAPKKSTPAKKAAPVAKTAKTKSVKDSLRKIEGIGPKIESLLNDNGIVTFLDLSKASSTKLKDILTAAGPNYAVHDPSTWAEQAKLADAGDWDKLDTLQDRLKGGRRV